MKFLKNHNRFAAELLKELQSQIDIIEELKDIDRNAGRYDDVAHDYAVRQKEIRAIMDIVKKMAADKSHQYVSLDTYEQIMHERDIAIEQLAELGYQLGEKVQEDWIPYVDGKTSKKDMPEIGRKCWVTVEWANGTLHTMKDELDKNGMWKVHYGYAVKAWQYCVERLPEPYQSQKENADIEYY